MSIAAKTKKYIGRILIIMDAPFSNRRQAGKKLAAKLVPHYANQPDVLVLALPRRSLNQAFFAGRVFSKSSGLSPAKC